MTKNLKFLSISLLLSLPFWYGVNFFQENLEKFFYAQISQPLEEITLVKIPEKTQKPSLDLGAKSALSLKINKAGKEKVLFRKNTQNILPIASLTKLMTAIIAIEDTENYDFKKEIIISKEAADQENVLEGGNLNIGEKISVEKLLHLMLVNSSNDAAFALSEVIGEKGENFVIKMIQKANDLGLQNTHFVNPTGLDPNDLHYSEETSNYFNYSTVEDLAKLARYILNEFPLIYEISASQPYYQVKNGFSGLYLKQNIIGGKTGYTKEAGGCMFLVLDYNPPTTIPAEGWAPKNGNYFINIILGTESASVRVGEMQKLIDWLQI